MAETAVGLLLFELAGYAYHRLAHAVPALWRLHELHHSSETMDWLASFRQHPLEILLMTLAQNAPLVLLGVPLGAHATVLVGLKLATVFVHSNVRVPLGPLRFIVATPRLSPSPPPARRRGRELRLVPAAHRRRVRQLQRRDQPRLRRRARAAGRLPRVAARAAAPPRPLIAVAGRGRAYWVSSASAMNAAWRANTSALGDSRLASRASASSAAAILFHC